MMDWSAYLMSTAARDIQKSAMVAINPERADARREMGDKRAVKKAHTADTRAIK